ncbi:replication termination factor 2-like [Ornithodoros turicata]|uniref:replication termination factor 2-like n=1 Tax=Ornithodoros turicata TaxID=34597 RepID=UPI00313A3E5C
MGCDGGTIPRRDELVRTKQKPEQKDKDAEAVAKWKHCAITQEELRLPVVSCDLGRLYNKEAVIEYLLNKEATSDIAKHIRSLKDLVELNLTENPTYRRKGADKGDEYVDHRASRFICPVVGLEMNGKYKFCYLRHCGCVLSERALKVKSDVCHKCGKPFEDDDIVVLNGTEEELSVLEEKMEARRLKAKLEKKSKKRATDIAVEDGKKKVKFEEPSKATGKLVNGGASTSEAKARPTTGTSTKMILPEKACAGYSIAKDPNTSEALKSLFTTHKTALNQEKAHWITHNPLYY